MAVAEKEEKLFATVRVSHSSCMTHVLICLLQDKNVGLLKQALERAPRWSIKKLTETYLTLSLSDIGREVGIADEEAVRGLVVSMVRFSICEPSHNSLRVLYPLPHRGL